MLCGYSDWVFNIDDPKNNTFHILPVVITEPMSNWSKDVAMTNTVATTKTMKSSCSRTDKQSGLTGAPMLRITLKRILNFW
ncbi:hypothetical protein M8J75_000082 [Diaphorina citri]|nr:hypothetical protein M8J75_000082 [Diaphorina citri]KAI5742252.1 hypothetical protein M8J77_005070 [Diaphorina citri]